MITKEKQMAARFFMLNAAVSKDDSRPALKHIYCDGDTIISTNGKIMVYTDNMEHLEKGYYDLAVTGNGRNRKNSFVPFKKPKSEEWSYPNWKQVVPDCTKGKQLNFCSSSAYVEQEIFKLQFELAAFGAGSLISQENIQLICKTGIEYNVRILDGFSPLIFEVPDFFSMLVMPRRGSCEVTTLLNSFTSKMIDEWKADHPAETAQPPVKAPEPAPEPVKAHAPAQKPVKAPEPAPEPVKAHVPAQKVCRKPPITVKSTSATHRKPAFTYRCELKNGSQITLDNIKAVQARKDVVTCRIEPVKRARKAA